MKRVIVIVAILLLAGAVVNVAVAWGCAAWSTLVSGPPPPITEEFSQLLTRIPTDVAGEMWVPHDEVGWWARTRTLSLGIGLHVEKKWARRRADRGELNRDRRDEIAVWHFRAGLPMLSLKGDYASLGWSDGVWIATRTDNGYLPYHPIWPVGRVFAHDLRSRCQRECRRFESVHPL